jgi:ABC-type phosphate/phosphonate transport system substrate-binding protein
MHGRKNLQMTTSHNPFVRSLLIVASLFFSVETPLAADLKFTVQPILEHDATLKAFKPLAEYIARASGKTVDFSVAQDYADYWFKMKRGSDYDLMLDAAHYVDYRIKHQQHIPLVKISGVVSYSLISLSSAMILEKNELIGKKIATLIPPAPGGLVLANMFDHPVRQPYIVPVGSSDEALDLLMQGKVDGAIVPTPLAAKAMADGKDVATITTSPQTPHISLTASAKIDPATREKITKALLEATENIPGRKMLKAIGFPDGFEPASAALYDGYSDILDQEWPQ